VKRAPRGFVVVLVTCGTRREAGRIARSLVSRRLAACVNVLETSVHSVYRWKGKVETAREFLLLIKSSGKRLAEVHAEVERLHSYEVSEFLVLPVVAGSRRYLAWLDASLRPGRS
jgi:periplasmic divalent cation tolerance protein